MKDTTDQTQLFALCLNNEGYPASLEVGKLYRMIPDEEAAAHGYIRIIDESGEDYAFTVDRFHLVPLPHAVGAGVIGGVTAITLTSRAAVAIMLAVLWFP